MSNSKFLIYYAVLELHPYVGVGLNVPLVLSLLCILDMGSATKFATK